MRDRVLRAGGWTVLAHGFVQITRLVSVLITTRLLAPEVFGVMAIAIAINTGFALFSDLGLLQSAVRSSRGNQSEFLDTLWLVQIARGFAIWAVSLAVAGGLAVVQWSGWLSGASVYTHPVLPSAIGAIGFSAVLAGLESTKVATARRELSLARLSQIEMLGNAVAVGTTIVLVLIDRSIWALVGGWIVGAAARAVLTHAMLPGLSNKFQWDSAAFLEILKFGKWVLFSSVLGFLVINSDQLLLGAFASADVLGLYAIAILIIGALRQAVSKLVSGVAFPAFSEVARTNPARLKIVYYQFKVPLDCLLLFAAGCLFVLGTPMVSLLFDKRYLGAGPIVEVLALAVFAWRYEIAEQCFLALGEPRYLTMLNGIRLTMLFLFVPAGYLAYQLPGAVWAIVLSTVSVIPAVLYFKSRLGLLCIRNELAVLPVFLLGGLLSKFALFVVLGR